MLERLCTCVCVCVSMQIQSKIHIDTPLMSDENKLLHIEYCGSVNAKEQKEMKVKYEKERV